MVSAVVPSKGNVTTKLASMVAGLATAYFASHGLDTRITSAIGLDATDPAQVMQITGALSAIVTALVAFALGHCRELYQVASVLADLPKIYAKPSDFPSDKNGQFPSPSADIGNALEHEPVVAVVNEKRSDFPADKNGK